MEWSKNSVLSKDSGRAGLTNARLWRWIVLISLIVNVVLNYWNNVRPLNGKTNGEISDQYPTLFTPAGFTFSIWGLIFLTLIIYAIKQVFPGRREDDLYNHLAPPLVLSNCLSILWVVLFSFELLGWSALVIILMLITSLVLLVKAHKFRGSFFVTLPFSLYSGWLTVATIAGIALWLTSMGWSGLPAPLCAVLLIVFSGALGVYVSNRLRDLIYPLVIAWGLLGIYVAQKNVSELVATSGIAVSALVMIMTAILRLRRGDRTAVNGVR